MKKKTLYRVEWLIQNITYYNRVPGTAGGSNKKRKKKVPAITVDTFRGGRKGVPQH